MTSSYRQILRSTSIISGSAVINIGLSLLRMKAAALLLGPAGVGLIGVFSNLIGVAISFAGLGLPNSGTRHIAEALGKNDSQSLASARRVLLWSSLILALLASTIFWFLRNVIAEYILNEPRLANDVGWLALAIGFQTLAAFQSGVLSGFRRIGDLSRISVYSAIVSSILGILSLWLWGLDGILPYLIVVPLFSFLVGRWYMAKLPKLDARAVSFSAVKAQGHTMLKLGSAFMLANSIGYSGQLFVRSLVQNELGIDALGYFQAASAISMTYIGFLLTSMSQDYYPRLTAVITDHHASNRMVNQQIELSLLLAGPIFLAMMALAPWVIELLYSPKFYPAAEVLQWQIIGDILKVVSWPLSYILIASGAGRAFVKNEIVIFCSLGLFTWLCLPLFGIAGSGVSFLGMNTVLLILLYWQVKRRIGFVFEPVVIILLIFLLISTTVLLILSRYSFISAAIVGLFLCALFMLYGFAQLAHKTELTGSLGKLALIAQHSMKMLGVWHD